MDEKRLKIHRETTQKVAEQNVKRVMKAGRKPLSEELRRTSRIAVRFNQKEMELIQDQIQNREMADVVRELALEAAKMRKSLDAAK